MLTHEVKGFLGSLELIRHIRNNTILEWTQKILDIPGRTVDVRILGTSIIWTDNIENIRAILSTQVTCKSTRVTKP